MSNELNTINQGSNVLFSANNDILIFNKKVTVANTTICTKNEFIFNTININKPIIINQNLNLSNNNIEEIIHMFFTWYKFIFFFKTTQVFFNFIK